MGVDLSTLIPKTVISLRHLQGRLLAVDANNALYQFLAVIRLRDGTPLKGPNGEITSHLAGLFFRSIRLISDYGIRLVYVFDGKPPTLKTDEIQRRRRIRDKAAQQWAEALERKDYSDAFSKAVVSSRLTREMTRDAQHLLKLLGIPYLQALGEAEAQASYMASRGDVYAAASQDFDSLLFGAPRLVRYLTIAGKEFLPSKGAFRALTPEIIELSKMRQIYNIDQKQLIDLGIIVGTDFNEGVKGIGPKKALRLIQEFHRIENLPDDIGKKVTPDYEKVRRIFSDYNVVEDYVLSSVPPHVEGVKSFLCGEKGFNRERVESALARFIPALKKITQTGLESFN